MKRILLVLLILVAFTGLTRAQVVADYEPITMNLMLGGSNDLSTMTVVPNPDQSGINTSFYCVKYERDMDGVPWGGFWCPLPTPIDVTVNKYVHVKVWKPRISPIKFKIEGGAAGTYETASMTPQNTTGVWEDMVFDFTSKTGTYPTIAFFPDFEDPLTLTNDIVIYFDDIIVNNDPNPNTPAVTVIEDYEIMPLNSMLGGANDSSYMTVVPNPDAGGINPSKYVIKFHRDKDGVPWGGFWSTTPVDVTTNKYMHVKVWKPRISPIRFKIEGGAAGTLEIASMSPQTVTGEWVDYVFDFSTKTGPYPIIAFMPDFEDPLTLTSDIDIYFDDIILNNDPNPAVANSVTLNVNMSYWTGLGIFDPTSDFVDVAGNFNGWNGADYHLTTTDNTIYSITLNDLIAGNTLEWKFRINGSWDDATCEFPSGGPNRTYVIPAGASTYNAWYNNDSLSTVTFEVNMWGYAILGIFNPAADFVDIAGNFNGWGAQSANYHLTTTDDSIYSITVDSLAFNSLIEFKFRINGSWSDLTCEFPNGGPNRTYTVPAGLSVYSAWYNNQIVGITEPSALEGIRIYPNPVADVLNIDLNAGVQSVTILNTLGQTLRSSQNLPAGTSSIDLSNLEAGMYLVNILGNNGEQLTVKFIRN